MNTLVSIPLSMLLLATLFEARAADSMQSSRSAGKLQHDGSIELASELEQREALIREIPQVSEDYASRQLDAQYAGVANRYDQSFEIYSADVQLLADLDLDGFHHALRLYFDVDVYHGDATVYAKLYLSEPGSPWVQYYTTGLFDIHEDAVDDTYEVETELLEGYAAGYYALLIEIYSLDHAYMVASEVLDHHYLGRDIPIEDLERDRPYHEEPVEYYEETYVEEVTYVSESGGGSMTSLLAVFLIIRLVIAARGPIALTPPKRRL